MYETYTLFIHIHMFYTYETYIQKGNKDMENNEYFNQIIKTFKKTADLVDKHKGNYDLVLSELTALYNFHEDTGDTVELIRLCFNVGFYRGIGYQNDYINSEEAKRDRQERNKQALINALMKAKTEAEIKEIVDEFSLERKDTEIASLTSSLMRATNEAQRKGVIYAFMGIETEPESKPKRGRKKKA